MIKVNDIVKCRLYNTPDKRFYGEYFDGQVLEIQKNTFDKQFKIKRLDLNYIIWLHRKEIKRIIRKG